MSVQAALSAIGGLVQAGACLLERVEKALPIGG
jgi:hypothetical protein